MPTPNNPCPLSSKRKQLLFGSGRLACIPLAPYTSLLIHWSEAPTFQRLNLSLSGRFDPCTQSHSQGKISWSCVWWRHSIYLPSVADVGFSFESLWNEIEIYWQFILSPFYRPLVQDRPCDFVKRKVLVFEWWLNLVHRRFGWTVGWFWVVARMMRWMAWSWSGHSFFSSRISDSNVRNQTFPIASCLSIQPLSSRAKPPRIRYTTLPLAIKRWRLLLEQSSSRAVLFCLAAAASCARHGISGMILGFWNGVMCAHEDHRQLCTLCRWDLMCFSGWDGVYL